MATRLRAELKTNTDSRVMAEGQRRPGRQMPPPGRGPPPPPQAKPAAPRLEPVDREKVLTLPLSRALCVYICYFDSIVFLCRYESTWGVEVNC
ncbi:UNVERIFIED_CONTAM: hypothetical protein Sangu_2310100 [Sesamum angustifolium]|uniref:Uncharacterized protein n=1 Tax=Sesamum angustifolium TaxID=2727405 RepID=A0AAW2L5L6_9LAMI